MSCRCPPGLRDTILPPYARRAIEAEFTSYSGVPTERESFLGMLACVKGGGLEKYWTENEVFRCVGGNQQLARRLVEQIGADAVQMRSPVESIVVTDSGAKVMCQTGKAYTADDVVLATPPSTWGAIQFDPPLPAVLRPADGTQRQVLGVTPRCLLGKVRLAPVKHERRAHWLHVERDGRTAGWTRARPGRVRRRHRGRCLIARQPDERDRTMKREVARRYPGFDESIVRSLFVDWPGQKWTQGSYSTPAPGQVTRQGPILAGGLGRLHFAGEHACLKFVGFMEGALNSGADSRSTFGRA